MPINEPANTSFIDFDLNQSGLEPTIYRTRDEVGEYIIIFWLDHRKHDHINSSINIRQEEICHKCEPQTSDVESRISNLKCSFWAFVKMNYLSLDVGRDYYCTSFNKNDPPNK